MHALAILLAIPLLGGLLLWALGERESAPEANAAFSFATFVAAAWVTADVVSTGPIRIYDDQFFLDSLNVFLVSLTAFVGFTTSLFSRPYMRTERDKGRMTAARLRLYHSMYQVFMFTMLLALTTNNMGILWVAMEAATLATVLLVSVYRTAASLEAAWKYFILCGVGIAQALFGTILLYFAAERVLGAEGNALLWTHLVMVKGQLEPAIMSLAFVFLLVGYGTKVGLVPLHNWLPDAHAEGPTPISAVLSGLLLNVALYSVVRCKVLADGALESRFAGNMMMGFGLLSVVVAAFFLSRQRDVKRMFAYSSIEHMGLMTFAFGMAGPIANFAGLLHMTVHSLVKSAIFFTVGHATQNAGTQVMDDIRGLLKVSPTVGWGLMIGTLAILGMPPFGVFASEFLILTTAMREHPWATPFLLLSLGVAFAAVFGRVQPMVFGDTHMTPFRYQPALAPVFVHLGLALMLGLYIPPYLAAWYHQAAKLLDDDEGIRRRQRRSNPRRRGAGRARARRPRRRLDRRGARRARVAGAPGVALGGGAPRRRARGARGLCPRGGPVRGRAGATPRGALVPRLVGAFPRGRAHAARGARPPRIRRRGSTRQAAVAAPRAGLSLRARGGRRRARDPGGADPRRHHRARPLPVLDRGREGAAPGAAAGLHAQGDRQALRGLQRRRGPPARRPRLGRLDRGVRLGLRAGRRGGGRHRASGARALATGPAARARAHRQPPRRPGRAWQRWRVRLRPLAVHAPEGGLAAGERRGVRASIRDGRHRSGRRRGGPRFPAKLAAMARHAHEIEIEVRGLRDIFDEHSGLQDRFITAGRVTPDLAARLGLVGLGGRSSGQAFDLRVDHPVDPYRSLKVKKVVYVAGDVAARVHARFDELFESVRLVQAIVAGMSAGEVRVPLPAPAPGAFGVGWVEGWRGEVLVALEAGSDGRIARCHAHDPSWHNWPVLEHAVIGNIVPDFPLINKSFNLSYSGADT